MNTDQGDFLHARRTVACGQETDNTAAKPTKTDNYTAIPTTVPAPRPQDPEKVTDDVKALWQAPHAAELVHASGTTPRMRAAQRLIGSYASAKVVPDKQAVEALLGKPDRGTTGTTWRYLLSVRHLPNDTCERDLEVEFRRDGALNGLTMDDEERCLSD